MATEKQGQVQRAGADARRSPSVEEARAEASQEGAATAVVPVPEESRIDQLQAKVRAGPPRLLVRAKALAAEFEVRYADALEALIAEEMGGPPSETYRVREQGKAFVNGAMTVFPKGMTISTHTHGAEFYLQLVRAGVKLDAVQ